MNIVFARTRYHYDSYIDYWKLVELSGFETCYVDEIDIRKHNVYIVSPFNGEYEPHINNQIGNNRNAYLIHWCLERPSGAGGVGNYSRSNRMHMYKRLFDRTWVSDKWLANESTMRFVVLGSDYGLGEPGDNKKYAFAHMSYMTDRRARVYNAFRRSDVAPNCWPPRRDVVLKASKFGLCVHQDQHPYQEPLRFALFAAYGLPILTEEIYSAFPWSEEFCVFDPYQGIAGRLRQMLGNDYGRWKDMGLRARDRMCKEFKFRDTVIRAVAEDVL